MYFFDTATRETLFSCCLTFWVLERSKMNALFSISRVNSLSPLIDPYIECVIVGQWVTEDDPYIEHIIVGQWDTEDDSYIEHIIVGQWDTEDDPYIEHIIVGQWVTEDDPYIEHIIVGQWDTEDDSYIEHIIVGQWDTEDMWKWVTLTRQFSNKSKDSKTELAQPIVCRRINPVTRANTHYNLPLKYAIATNCNSGWVCRCVCVGVCV